MRILFINPKSSSISNNKNIIKFINNSNELKYLKANWVGINYGLLILAAITPKIFNIMLIDENFDEINFSEKYDIVAISAITSNINRAYEIADKFRKNGVKIVIGGIHATVLPEEAKKHADSVVIGEAEYIWMELLKDFKKNKLKPYYKSNKVVDLKDSPIPRYDLIKSKKYNTIWIQTSRGCPHDCEFCCASNIYGKKFRTKTLDQIINEIKLVKKIFGNITIGFGDDNFFVNKKNVKSLLKKIIPLNIRWITQTDISIAKDEELLNLMRQSGCQFVFIGFETVTENGLRNIDIRNWKFKNYKNYVKYINKIQSNGIGVIGSFIVGLDNDDKRIFKKIISFINDNMLYDGQIAISTPLPGTRLRERLIKGLLQNTKRHFLTGLTGSTGFYFM